MRTVPQRDWLHTSLVWLGAHAVLVVAFFVIGAAVLNIGPISRGVGALMAETSQQEYLPPVVVANTECPPGEGDVKLLFADNFNDGLNTSLWTWVDTQGNLSVKDGRLAMNHNDNKSLRDPYLASKQSFDWQPGLLLAVMVRPTVQRNKGPLIGFSSSNDPVQDIENTVGWYGEFGTFNSWTPVVSSVLTSFWEPMDNYDTILYLLLRQQGFLGLLGGSNQEMGKAVLGYVSDVPLASQLNLSLQSGGSFSYVDVVCVYGLPWDDRQLATLWDDFNRADSSNLGFPRKSDSPWLVISGNWQVNNSQLVCGEEGMVTVDTHTADGWVDMAVQTPEEGHFSAGLVFRMSDTNNYWLWRGTDELVRLEKIEDGVTSVVYQAGFKKLDHGSTHHLKVHDMGDRIEVWLDEVNMRQTVDPIVDGFNAKATVSGMMCNPGGVRVLSFYAWPHELLMPAPLDRFSSIIPDTTGLPISRDDFDEVGELPLSQHLSDSGNIWRVYSGDWLVKGGVVTLRSPGVALATLETGSPDMAAEATILLPSAPVLSETSGVVVRASGPGNYVHARFLWQGGSPEIEIWETVAGVSRIINAVQLRGRYNLGEEHNLRLAIVGREVAAYLDGDLVLQATISEEAHTRLNGTQAGLIQDDIGTGGSIFLDFQARQAAFSR